MQCRIDAGVAQNAGRARFRVVAAIFGELPFELGRTHVIILGRLRIAVDTVALLHRPPHLRVSLQHHVEHALSLVGELILIELPETQPRLQHHHAHGLFQLAAQHLHEGRLAATVRADQAVAIAIRKLDRDLLEQRLGTELNRDIGS